MTETISGWHMNNNVNYKTMGEKLSRQAREELLWNSIMQDG
jgi:phosphoribosylformimino-5-aminoimidazole carboxamide ribonucleotide (ProFAR) isomerase